MKLTRERKILMSVLGLGLSALVLDRLVLSEPSSAHAAGPEVSEAIEVAGEPTPSGTPTVAPTVTDSATEPPRYSALSKRLRALSEDYSSTDAPQDLFAQPQQWAPPVVAVPVKPGRSGPIEDPEEFLQAYALSAVIETNQGTVAYIDGKALPVGTVLESFILRGFLLNQSSGRSAFWESIKTGQVVVMRELSR